MCPREQWVRRLGTHETRTCVFVGTRQDAGKAPGRPEGADLRPARVQAETVPGYEAYAVAGFAAPAATPVDIVRSLNAAINAGLADAAIKQRLSALGVTLLTGSPEDFARRIALETEKWAQVIRSVGIKPN